MIYSVFNWNSGLYKYYKGPGENRGERPKARVKLNPSSNGRGQQPEALLVIVPKGAQPVGQGKQAKGRIAVLSSEATTTHNRNFSVEGLQDTLKGLRGLQGFGEYFPKLSGRGAENPLKTHPVTTTLIYAGSLIALRKTLPHIIDYVGDLFQ